ncbi:Rieske 2Fe-2S domain-containing protein [Mycobacteroides salmoniphilum]|uniref:Rieske 2Fe-2S domain-containing protein n=1 Tax=Mycobacteroides salmoniphilum TaxID=404941 RepID=UPI0010ED59D4|nr:Rieske 2Fe-2S domain-containing protein [Mycobacteroides salmoniphilum]TDZ99327.1 Cytochrome b6-f complex iron-sulfur subunit [Mycobacteroides salmoniphilum]
MKLPKLARRALSESVQLLRQSRQTATYEAPGRLRPGQAIVTLSDGKRVGVYCDDDGQLHAVVAVCTHINWELEFNAKSRCWDCPRHGAKFAIDGAVIDGPATIPLTTVSLPD